jgi:DNA-binding NarL/FixJ family response regulator
MSAIRVVLVDDHPVVRSGIRTLIEGAGDIEVVGEGSSGAEAFELVARLAPAVLLLDMEMPGLSGIDVARRLHAEGSPVRILALSAYDDEQYVIELLAIGAAGYLTKDEALDTIADAVRGVAAGEEGWFSRRATARMVTWTRRAEAPSYQLTTRELDVLRLLAKGWTNGAIAAELNIAERTVRFHLRHLYDKLEVNTRGEAMARALGEGLV